MVPVVVLPTRFTVKDRTVCTLISRRAQAPLLSHACSYRYVRTVRYKPNSMLFKNTCSTVAHYRHDTPSTELHTAPSIYTAMDVRTECSNKNLVHRRTTQKNRVHPIEAWRETSGVATWHSSWPKQTHTQQHCAVYGGPKPHTNRQFV